MQDPKANPASMEFGKTIDFHGSLPGTVVEQADAEQAYIQADLKGPTTWVLLPEELWPDDWWVSAGDGTGGEITSELIDYESEWTAISSENSKTENKNMWVVSWGLDQDHQADLAFEQSRNNPKLVIEGDSKKSDQDFKGRNSQNKMFVFPKQDGLKAGDYTWVKVESVSSATMKGQIVEQP